MGNAVEKRTLLRRVHAMATKLGKYRWAVLILLLGVGLMLLPGGSTENVAEPTSGVVDEQQLLEQTQQALQTLLQRVEGAGAVEVLLSFSVGTERVYEMDRTQERSGEQVKSTQSVVLQQSGSNRTPVVCKTLYPVYQGAVIACQGADSARVRLAIVEAVSSLTGLGSDKISVIQLKAE